MRMTSLKSGRRLGMGFMQEDPVQLAVSPSTWGVQSLLRRASAETAASGGPSEH